MDDQMLDLMDPGDRMVGRLLQVYGEEALSPRTASTTRTRMSVMAAAHRRAALIEADAALGTARTSTTVHAANQHRPTLVAAWRRHVAAVMAGCLTLGILAGSAFAASPGGLLYDARIWTEMASLPATGVERAEAEVQRLQQRIGEALQASKAGDGVATGAVLAAYSSIVAEAARSADGDPAASAVIEAAVSRHVLVLTQLIQSAPPPARAALEHALGSSTRAIDALAGGIGPNGIGPGDGVPVNGGGVGGPADANGTAGDGRTDAGASAPADERPSAAPAGGEKPDPDKTTGHDGGKPSRDRNGQHLTPTPTSDAGHGSSSGSTTDQP